MGVSQDGLPLDWIERVEDTGLLDATASPIGGSRWTEWVNLVTDGNPPIAQLLDKKLF